MTGSDFPVTSRLNDYINTGLSELQDTLIDSGYGDYLLSEVNVSLVSGTEKYELPRNFGRMLHVFFLSAGDQRRYPDTTG